MAYHHHHHHAPPPTNSAPSCYCCYSSTPTHQFSTPTPPPPPPPPPVAAPLALPDPLLVDAVISRLLHMNSYQTPRNSQTHQSYQHYRRLLKTPDFPSLIDRIEALEASLHRFSFSAGSIVSVRDAAARVIQRRFRAFLARRSRILRQLQELAVVKSSYTALRSSVSNSSCVRFDHVSRKVDGLLLQLDSIEEDDPMIREGKRSVGKNLDRFLRYVDERCNEVLSSRRNNGRRVVSSARKDNIGLRAQREMANDLKGRVERIRKMSRALEREEGTDYVEVFDEFSDLEEKTGRVSVINGVRPLRNGSVRGISSGGNETKENVKFAKNSDAYKVISNSDGHSSIEGENDSSDDSVEALEKFKKIEVKDSSKDDEEEGQEDSGGSYSDGNDGGMSGGRHVRKEGRSGMKRDHHGPGSVFTPPVPEKMESVADSMTKKKKEVKL